MLKTTQLSWAQYRCDFITSQFLTVCYDRIFIFQSIYIRLPNVLTASRNSRLTAMETSMKIEHKFEVCAIGPSPTFVMGPIILLPATFTQHSCCGRPSATHSMTCQLDGVSCAVPSVCIRDAQLRLQNTRATVRLWMNHDPLPYMSKKSNDSAAGLNGYIITVRPRSDYCHGMKLSSRPTQQACHAFRTTNPEDPPHFTWCPAFAARDNYSQRRVAKAISIKTRLMALQPSPFNCSIRKLSTTNNIGLIKGSR